MYKFWCQVGSWDWQGCLNTWEGVGATKTRTLTQDVWWVSLENGCYSSQAEVRGCQAPPQAKMRSAAWISNWQQGGEVASRIDVPFVWHPWALSERASGFQWVAELRSSQASKLRLHCENAIKQTTDLLIITSLGQLENLWNCKYSSLSISETVFQFLSSHLSFRV